MTEPLLIPCPHCNGLNRIPAERIGEHPKCGRCKNAVLLAKPFDLKQTDYPSQIKGDLPLLVDVWAEWCDGGDFAAGRAATVPPAAGDAAAAGVASGCGSQRQTRNHREDSGESNR